MNIAVAIATLVLLATVIAIVSSPLRNPRPVERLQAPAHAELEAAREAKYREIRDAELDYRTGKLSTEDYQTIDATLRAEALEILEQIEALERDA